MKKYGSLFAFPALLSLHLLLVGMIGTWIMNANAQCTNSFLNFLITIINCMFYFFWIWRFSLIQYRKTAWLAIAGGSFCLLLCMIILLFYTSHFSIQLKLLSFTYYYEILFHSWPGVLLGSGIAYLLSQRGLKQQTWKRCLTCNVILLFIIALLFIILISIAQYFLFENLFLYTLVVFVMPIVFFLLLSFWISISFYFRNEKYIRKHLLTTLFVEVLLCLFAHSLPFISNFYLFLIFTVFRLIFLLIGPHQPPQNQKEIHTWI